MELKGQVIAPDPATCILLSQPSILKNAGS